MKTQAISGAQLLLDPLLGLFVQYLILAWGIILFIGDFIAATLIALGLIMWLSGWKPARGRQMVLGGVVLFIAMDGCEHALVAFPPLDSAIKLKGLPYGATMLSSGPAAWSC